MDKNGVGAVVATSLFLVTAIISIISFQTWFNNYSSTTLNKVENTMTDTDFVIDQILANTLYVKNNLDYELRVNSLKIGDVDCNLDINLSEGMNSIDISSCSNQLTSNSQDIVIYTDNAIVSKKIFIRDFDENAPYLSFSSNSTLIPFNSSINLSWVSNNLNSCLGEGNWSGVKSTQSSEVLSNLIGNVSYTLNCSYSEGYIAQSIDVEVSELPIITFNATNTTLDYNATTSLNWNVLNADSCIASGNWSGSKGTNGSETTGNLSDGIYEYTLTCTGFGGTSISSVEINVSENLLYQSSFSPDDCTNAGGTVTAVTGGDICKFSASSCPGGGWSQFNSYSTTSSNYCVGCTAHDPAYYCSTGGHSFANTARETCTYRYTSWVDEGGEGPQCWITNPSAVCYASITEIGCN